MYSTFGHIGIVPVGNPGLGLVASHRRMIRPGDQYNRYFDKPTGSDPLLSKDATVYKTVDLIKEIVSKTNDQCSKIAPVLKGSSVKETCRNIYDFLYNHIQYKIDSAVEEQVRSPYRSWKDRRTGIDCDCYATFASCILVQLNIRHKLRICELNNKGYFQHIYVVVPSGGEEIIIDPVLDKFNQEAPNITKKYDKDMDGIPVRFLNGIDPLPDNYQPQLSLVDRIRQINGLGCSCDQYASYAEMALREHFENGLHNVKYNGQALAPYFDVNKLQQAYEYILASWNNPQARQYVLQELARTMGKGLCDESSLSGLSDTEIYNPFSEFSSAAVLNGMLGKIAIGQKVKQVIKSPVINPVAAVKKVAEKVPDNVKSKVVEVAKAVAVKYNPGILAVRAGFLVALKTNLFQIAEHLRWALMPDEYVRGHNITPEFQKRSKELYVRVEKFFVDTMEGSREQFKKAILEGKAEVKNNATNGLGEAVSAGATVAAASGVIGTVVGWMKKLFDGVEKVKKVADKANEAKEAFQSVKNLIPQKNGSSSVDPSSALPSQETSYQEAPGQTPSIRSEGDAIQSTTAKKGNGMLVLGLVAAAGIAVVAMSGGSGGHKTKGLSGTRSKSKPRKRVSKIVIK